MAAHGDDLGDTGDCEELDYEEEYPVTGTAQDKDEEDNMEEDSQQDSQVAGGSSEEASAAVDPASSSTNTQAGEDHQQDVHADNASADDSVDAADDSAVAVDATAATASEKLDDDMNGEDTRELITDAAVATTSNGSTTVAADDASAADTREAVDSATNGAADEEVVVLDDATDGVAGAGLDSGDTAADSTGSENKSFDSSNDKHKKPIKKITMEGFAGDVEVGIVSSVEEPNSDLSCVLCNLVFSSNKYLDGHRDHRDHSYVLKGKSPNSGRYSCLLCWKAFSREELLKEHIERKDHISRCKDKGMIGFYSPPAKFAVMRESEKNELREKERDRETRQKLKRLSVEKMGPSAKKVNFNHLFEVDSVGECDTFGIKVRKLHIDRQSSRKDKSRSPFRQRSSRSSRSPRRSSQRSPRSSDKRSTTQSSTQEKDVENNTEKEPNIAAPETAELNTESETNAILQGTELMDNTATEIETALGDDDAAETNHQEARENNQGEDEQSVPVQAPGEEEQDVQAPGEEDQDVQAPGEEYQDVQAPGEEMKKNQDQTETTEDSSQQNMDVDGESSNVAAVGFFDDPRVKICWITPRPGLLAGGYLSSLQTSASFLGGTCHTCYRDCRNHSLNKRARLFVLGDQFIPPVIGGDGLCCPVIRVNDGTFEHLKDLITFHIGKGLKIPAGSKISIFLLSYLMKVGHDLYWSEMIKFRQFVRNTLNLTVLPGLPPFPAGADPSNLEPISQFFHHLKGSYLGDGPVEGDSSFLLWKPFHETSLNLSSRTTRVVAPPLLIQETNLTINCDQQFTSGFVGSWEKGMPENIQLDFLKNIFDVLSDYNLSLCGLSLPPIASLQTCIKNNPLQGKKIFLVGTSILKSTAPAIVNMGQAKGVQVISEFSKGDFIKHFREISSDMFKQASREDILVLSFLGNYLLNKDDVINAASCHLVNPTIPCDSTMSTLVIDVGRIIRTLSSAFPGRIYLFGPLERHLASCCDLPDHRIRGPNNEDVDMSLYTKAFSSFIHASPGIVQERVRFIHPQEIYFRDFDSSFLADGVHLTTEATNRLASFIFNLLSARKKFKMPRITNDDFLTHLVKCGVIDAGKEDDTSSDPIDDGDTPMTASKNDAKNSTNNGARTSGNIDANTIGKNQHILIPEVEKKLNNFNFKIRKRRKEKKQQTKKGKRSGNRNANISGNNAAKTSGNNGASTSGNNAANTSGNKNAANTSGNNAANTSGNNAANKSCKNKSRKKFNNINYKIRKWGKVKKQQPGK